jgi:hypothetical protein
VKTSRPPAQHASAQCESHRDRRFSAASAPAPFSQTRRVPETAYAATPANPATVQKKHVSGVKKHFQASEHVTATVVESIDNIIDLAAERARRAPPLPSPLAPEAYDFRVVARDPQGKLKLVTSAGAFEDFEQAAAFAVTLMDCWQADYATVDVCTVSDGEFCPIKVVDAS